MSQTPRQPCLLQHKTTTSARMSRQQAMLISERQPPSIGALLHSPPLPTKLLLTTLSVFCCTTKIPEPVPLGELFAVKLQPETEVVNPLKVPRTPAVPTPEFAMNLHVHTMNWWILDEAAGSQQLPSIRVSRGGCD